MISNDLLKKKILDSAIHGKLIDNDLSLNPVELNQCTGEYLFDIPSNWKWVRFGDLVKDCYQGINTAGDKVEFVESDGVPIIQVGDMTSGKINISNTKLMCYDDYEFYKEKYQPKYNDIFYCNIGTIGCPLIYRENYKMLFHWNIFVIKYNEKYSDIVFLKWCLEYYTDIFKNMTSGSAMKFVSKKKLLDTLFPVPPLEEQHRIANKIEELFELIEKKEKNDQEKAKLKEILKEKILDSAINGDLLKNANREIWKKEVLGNVGDWKAGSTPSKDNLNYYLDGTIPWLLTGDLNDGIVKSVGHFVTELAYKECSLRLNPVNSVLIAMYGATIGKVAINEIETTTNQACCACICDENIIYYKYLFYYLISIRDKLKSKAEGAGQPNISKLKICNTSISLPPLEEQHRIVEKIEQCFELIKQL